MAQYPAAIELSDLDGDNGFRIDGVAYNDRSGYSVASAGDINGDGFADLIVGAAQADPHGESSGSSYVVFGKASGFDAVLHLSALDGDNGFRLDGAAAGDRTGSSVASAGDVNGDGLADLIVGASTADPGAAADAGSSYVVFGRAGGFDATLQLSALDGTDGFRIDGLATGDHLGFSVASAGDVNGDGFTDLIVGAYSADPGGVGGAGSSYVVFGKAAGFGAALELSSLDGANGFRIDGAASNNASGYSVASAGDVNGDGFADVVIGAVLAAGVTGATYVVFGKAAGFDATLDLSSLDGADGFRIDGVTAGDSSGHSVASAGDINGDGFADLIIGASAAEPHGIYSGSSYVVFGKAGGFAATLSLSALDGTNGFRLDGGASNDDAGYSVASAGDVNGDGFADLIVGAPGADPNGTSAAGASYVVFGKAGGFAATMDLSALDGTDGFRIGGVSSLDFSGRSVASAGDVNGDGLDDLVVGARTADTIGGVDAGSSYVIFGRLPDVAVARSGTEASQSLVGGDFGDVLKSRGGDDRLWGHGGADKMAGGTGDDTLIGGGGQDKLIGNAGDDTFIFQTALDSHNRNHADLIKDLDAGDIIDLSGIDADKSSPGNQDFTLVGAFSHHTGELTLTASADGQDTWLEGDTNGDGVADFAVSLRGDHHDFAGLVL